MRVYVAASSAEIPRARLAITALRAAGLDLVGHDWIDAVARHGSAGAALDLDERRRRVRVIVGGLALADVLLVLAAPGTMLIDGKSVELGVVVAMQRANKVSPPIPERRRIVIAGGSEASTLWHSIADYCAPTDDDAVRWIVKESST